MLMGAECGKEGRADSLTLQENGYTAVSAAIWKIHMEKRVVCDYLFNLIFRIHMQRDTAVAVLLSKLSGCSVCLH